MTATAAGDGDDGNLSFRCFHCREVMVGEEEAEAHFGRTEVATPACQIKASELSLVGQIRALEKDRDGAISSRDAAETDAESAWWSENAVLRAVPKATSAHDVRCHIESITGRALTAEALLVEIERMDPSVLHAARQSVCGEGVYCPMACAAPLIDAEELQKGLPKPGVPGSYVMKRIQMYAVADDQGVGHTEKKHRHEMMVRSVMSYAEAYGVEVAQRLSEAQNPVPAARTPALERQS